MGYEQFTITESLDCPVYSSFRLNTLKNFDLKILNNVLNEQKLELNTEIIPRFYLLRKDCLVIERWSNQTVVEKSDKEVIVDPLCAAAVLRGSHVFACGVIGLSNSCKIGEKVNVYGDIEGKCKKGLKTNYTGKKVFVGIGFLKMERRELFVNNMKPRTSGAIVCGWVVNAKPEERILDMCAAPGNKTTHLAEMSNNQAHITAIDKTQQKVEKIKVNCETLGIDCVNVYMYDSTKIACKEKSNTKFEPPFLPNTFDKVLLDAPCSGLGQRPIFVNKMTPKILQSYTYLQRKLFREAVIVLRTGGFLIYSTCTNNEEENENMVVWVLRNFPNMKLVPAEPLLGGVGSSTSLLSNEERLLVQRFGPDSKCARSAEAVFQDTIGFFIAKFQKIND